MRQRSNNPADSSQQNLETDLRKARAKQKADGKGVEKSVNDDRCGTVNKLKNKVESLEKQIVLLERQVKHCSSAGPLSITEYLSCFGRTNEMRSEELILSNQREI